MLADLTLAARSLLRNRRRTLTTVIAIAIGCVAMVVFGGFSTAISLGLESSIARRQGHLHIYPQGYLDYGAANPSDYAIDAPDRLIDAIQAIAELKGRIVLATPILELNGIAGNFREQASKTFAGLGVRPDDMNRLAVWDGYGIGGSAPHWGIASSDSEGAVIGIGMARMLSLCDELQIDGCHDRVKTVPQGDQDQGIQALMNNLGEPSEAEGQPVIDLLAATGQGAPNVVSVLVREGARQSVTAMDDMFVGMHLTQAQKLLYGGEDKATAIVLQLSSLAAAAEVREILAQHLPTLQPGLEVRELDEFEPMFGKILGMFNAVFVFVALVIAIVVLFTVANTMTMSVIERTGEVGTLRALGVRRSGIRRQFLLEGLLIGTSGASLGILLGILVSQLISSLGLSWSPPSSPVGQPLVILPLARPLVPLLLWLVLIVVTILSSLAPAARAARQTIVDAIHHI